MARYSYPTRSSRPGVFRQASREAVQRRRRLGWLSTATEGTSGVIWSVGIDWDADGYDAGDDDVTSRALMPATIQAEYGRDQARALLPMTSGRATAELDNQDKELSPDNVDSALSGRILPARPWRVQARMDGVTYTVFAGHLDDYTLRPRLGERTVQISGLDAVARLKNTRISTALYEGVRTGTAIGHVLDAIGFTGERDLDPGATVIRWWWAEDEDAFTAISELVESEGPGAFVHADANGGIVFRDRHHRLLNDASTTPQAFFEPGTDLSFQDMTLDLGWSDIVNKIQTKVDEWDPAPVAETVWESADVRTIGASATLEIAVTVDDPVVDPELTFTTLAGSVTSAIVQNTAQGLTLQLTAGGADAVVQDLVVTGQPVQVRRSYQVEAEDSTSIGRYGERDPLQLRARWAGVHDAAALADLVLAARAERAPLVTITLISGTREAGDAARVKQQLGRDLSDRVHIRELDNTCVDYDMFLERIKHRISDGGMLLATEFTLEKAAQQAANVFRFDDADYGFDNGVFAAAGLDDPEAIFIFDDADRGFGEGVFAS